MTYNLVQSLSVDQLRTVISDEEMAAALDKLTEYDRTQTLITFHTPLSDATVLDAVAELVSRMEAREPIGTHLTIKHFTDSHSVERPKNDSELGTAALRNIASERYVSNGKVVRQMLDDGVKLCHNCSTNVHYHPTTNELANCECPCKGWQ